MKTIADEAGVTLSTVSRILNDKGDNFAEETRSRILEIARRYKYRPNALVHAMQTGKSGTAGVMVPCSGFYSDIVCGIHDVFIEQDTIMLVSWNNRSVNKREEQLERRIIHKMVDRRVDGVLLRPSSEEFEASYFEEIWERQIPLILIDRDMSTIETDFVGTDDLFGGQGAAEYLISQGHRKLLFVGLEQISTSKMRESGFRSVVDDTFNASCGPTIFLANEGGVEEFYRAMKVEPPPTAIFAYNDDSARLAIRHLKDMGLSVPGDVSVMGFGNISNQDDGLTLTTFEQHPFRIGQQAARLYLERVQDEDPAGPRHVVIKPELMVKASTRPISG